MIVFEVNFFLTKIFDLKFFNLDSIYIWIWNYLQELFSFWDYYNSTMFFWISRYIINLINIIYILDNIIQKKKIDKIFNNFIILEIYFFIFNIIYFNLFAILLIYENFLLIQNTFAIISFIFILIEERIFKLKNRSLSFIILDILLIYSLMLIILDFLNMIFFLIIYIL